MNSIPKALIVVFSIFCFFSCEPADIANTASAVEGNYLVTSISAKTGQGQSSLQSLTDKDIVVLSKTGDRSVNLQIFVENVAVKLGSSQEDFVKKTYSDVLVEGNRENNSFQLSKITNYETNASLSGSINEDGRLTLSYRISGTEFFSITAIRR
ncbi:hypothetical protein [Flammeovirga aprica]|uniref:Lipocalin-like domain-containing protein n=1 Tax=Flammeovirga aprica JL-4 TaxID=694437 RepID=A0A7X9RUF0_9BACT|nr:hypothetical protein [Flammeovirga aprica]NME68901.1 hypothetical protein [Flammeovirga aprica JL-4]